MSLRRYAAKVDDNQLAIVEALRAAGATVEVIGEPVDLAVGFRGKTWLMEVKDGQKTPSQRQLTEKQAAFMLRWRGGPAVVVESVQEALATIWGK